MKCYTAGPDPQTNIAHDASGDHIGITMNDTQLVPLGQAYSVLQKSVYDAIIPQTRLKPYLDNISLALDANGTFSLDFGGMRCVANDAFFETR